MLFKYFWQCNLLIPVLPLSEPVAKTEQWRHHNRRSEAGGPHSGWSHSCRGTHLAPEADHPRQLGSGQWSKFWLWRHLYYFLKMDQFYQFFEITFISLYNQAKINIHYIPSVEVLCFVFDGKFQLPMGLHNSCMQYQPTGWRNKEKKIIKSRDWGDDEDCSDFLPCAMPPATWQNIWKYRPNYLKIKSLMWIYWY